MSKFWGAYHFDNTQNIYIEGDNLDVLKLLRETYLNKVKMIYIDPPYNTGNDFVYEDDYAQSASEYLSNSDQYDSQGNRLFVNNESNGRFHTDWLNMIYPRLKIAKDLLTDDGVIFASIGQDELSNLTRIFNEIFGEKNKLGIISHQMKTGGGTQGKYFAHNVDYILVYGNYDVTKYFKGELSKDLIDKVYNKVQQDGSRKGQHYRTMGLYQSSLGIRPSLRYFIKCPDGELVIPPGNTFPSIEKEGVVVKPEPTDGVWRWSYSLYQSEYEKGNVEFVKTNNGVLLNSNGETSKWNIYTKIWLDDRQDEGTIPNDLMLQFENRHSSKELAELDIPFDFAKPVGMIEYLIRIINQKDDFIVLDFFSGSATTAHAVINYNYKNNKKNKYILIQIPEKCSEKTEAYKKGYTNICEIGEERIRRASKKIKEEAGLLGNDLDVGFRVFKLDSSNMNDVFYNPNATTQTLLDTTVDNVKPDRTPLDLLFQVMLELGIELSAKIEEKEILGKKYFIVNENDLVACFDNNITNDVVKEIASIKPIYAVFVDSVFANDSANINCEQLFKSISPSTTIKVL